MVEQTGLELATRQFQPDESGHPQQTASLSANSLRNGLDFLRERSVSSTTFVGPVWPTRIPAPLAMPPLWGFGGDGA